MPANSRVGHFAKRHPRCPACAYDLIATVDARGNVCPECGVEFELHELVYDVRPGDWTVARGLRRLARTLVVRSVVAGIVWMLVIYALTWLSTWVGSVTSSPVPQFVSIFSGLAIVIAGGGIGAVIAHRIDEAAGFSSVLLVIIVLLTTWTVIGLIAWFVALLGLAPSVLGVRLRSVTVPGVPVSGVLAFAIILKKMVFDNA